MKVPLPPGGAVGITVGAPGEGPPGGVGPPGGGVGPPGGGVGAPGVESSEGVAPSSVEDGSAGEGAGVGVESVGGGAGAGVRSAGVVVGSWAAAKPTMRATMRAEEKRMMRIVVGLDYLFGSDCVGRENGSGDG